MELRSGVMVWVGAAWVVGLLLMLLLPVVNDSGERVLFAGGPAFLDFPLYASSHAGNASALFRPFMFLGILYEAGGAAALDWLRLQTIVPGPIYPWLVYVSGYPATTLPLSSLYLVLGVGLGVAWSRWAAGLGAARVIQVLVGAFPLLVYYTVLVSTDLLFAALVWIVWIVLNRTELSQRGTLWLLAGVATLAVLTRPTAMVLIPIALFALLHTYGAIFFARARGAVFIAFLFALAMWGLIYYAPYYLVHQANGARTHYFGILPEVYWAGMFPQLPNVLNQGLSVGLLILAKLLHAVGLRPSYAELDPLLTLLRALPSLVLLPGLIYGLLSAPLLQRMFVALFMVPVFIAASQERYLLGVMPILLFWGFQFWSGFFHWVRNRAL